VPEFQFGPPPGRGYFFEPYTRDPDETAPAGDVAPTLPAELVEFIESKIIDAAEKKGAALAAETAGLLRKAFIQGQILDIFVDNMLSSQLNTTEPSFPNNAPPEQIVVINDGSGRQLRVFLPTFVTLVLQMLPMWKRDP